MNEEGLIMSMMVKLQAEEERALLLSLWKEHSERSRAANPAVPVCDSRHLSGTQQSLDFGKQDDFLEQFDVTSTDGKEGGVFRLRKRRGRGENEGVSFDDRVHSGRVRVYIGRMHFGDAGISVFAFKELHGIAESRRAQAESLREAIVQMGGANVFAQAMARRHGFIE